jgi:hypothetical protein
MDYLPHLENAALVMILLNPVIVLILIVYHIKIVLVIVMEQDVKALKDSKEEKVHKVIKASKDQLGPKEQLVLVFKVQQE